MDLIPVMIGAIGFLGAFVCLIVAYDKGIMVPDEGYRSRVKRMAFVFTAIACFTVVSPLVMEFSNSGRAGDRKRWRVVWFDDNGQARGSLAAFCWNECANIPTSSIQVGSEVKPITPNPKVRDLSYRIEVNVVDFGKLFQGEKPDHIWSSEEGSEFIKRIIAYQLYEFNNTYSNQLTEFYNPLDNNQKARLEALLKEHVGPRLNEKGLEMIRLVEFDVK